MSYEPVPTGRMRLREHHRSGLIFSKPSLLVLQVEVDFPVGPSDANGCPEWLAGRTWIDADVTHLPIIPLNLS
ncbi:hypothetical protein P9A47_gp02 [Xanthomonas phage Elanor]|uniref:Uncharacterized protein n=1 Tax=Xanthomonas phage Elanor TaxID=2939127 RepID=A0A9E7J589_9CAUD|nr:hypothetical protein P9A47_gp02 [Xanthomonas phage Elanor]URA06970.1 hypothetical protein Elanor_BL4002 [Xanthomonas phage Elanor]